MQRGKEEMAGLEETQVFKDSMISMEKINEFHFLSFPDRSQDSGFPKELRLQNNDIVLLSDQRHPNAGT